MRVANSGKVPAVTPALVAVIASVAELGRAARLRRLPDFFELRLDALCDSLAEVAVALAGLRAPLIVTARHPAEGGVNDLAAAERRSLLLQFLPRAEYVDIELRSLPALDRVRVEAARRKIKLIVSVHEFRRTPSLQRSTQLGARARAAAPDVFKLVTRVDTSADLEHLTAAFDLLSPHMPVSAMGTGPLGRESRKALVARGSVLNYAHLGSAQADGQLSIRELRRLMRSR